MDQSEPQESYANPHQLLGMEEQEQQFLLPNHPIINHQQITKRRSNKSFYVIVLFLAIIVSLLSTQYPSQLYDVYLYLAKHLQTFVEKSPTKLVGKQCFERAISLGERGKVVGQGGRSDLQSIYGTMIIGVEDSQLRSWQKSREGIEWVRGNSNEDSIIYFEFNLNSSHFNLLNIVEISHLIPQGRLYVANNQTSEDKYTLYHRITTQNLFNIEFVAQSSFQNLNRSTLILTDNALIIQSFFNISAQKGESLLFFAQKTQQQPSGIIKSLLPTHHIRRLFMPKDQTSCIGYSQQNIYWSLEDLQGFYKISKSYYVIYTYQYANKSSQQYKTKLKVLIDKSQVEVKVLREEDLHFFELKEDKYPLIVSKLSRNHRQDYMRAYIMHHYGGGFTNFNETHFPWLSYFEQFQNDPAKIWLYGYSIQNPKTFTCHIEHGSLPCSEIFKHYIELLGANHYITRKNTQFTSDWLNLLLRILKSKSSMLDHSPSNSTYQYYEQQLKVDKSTRYETSLYPFRIYELSREIFTRLCYKHRGHFLINMPLSTNQEEIDRTVHFNTISYQPLSNKTNKANIKTASSISLNAKQQPGTKKMVEKTVFVVNLAYKNTFHQSIKEFLYDEQDIKKIKMYHYQRLGFIANKKIQSLHLIAYNMLLFDYLDVSSQKQQQIVEYERVRKIHNLDEIKTELPLCISVNSFNNEPNNRIQYNLNSIFTQNYTNYFVVLTNDFSFDNTDQMYQRYFQFYNISKDLYVYVNNTERKGGVSNFYNALTHHCSEDSIVMFVDGDDQLIGKNIFKIFNAQHQRFKAGLIYSNHLLYGQGQSINIGISNNYTRQQMEKRDFRKAQVKHSHLRSIRTSLFRKIGVGNFTNSKGQFIRSATDLAIVIPIMELACGRIKHIQGVHYLYNGMYGNNHWMINSGMQGRSAELIQQKPVLTCDKDYEKLPFSK